MTRQAPSFDPSRAPEYELLLEVGNPSSPHGLTRATLDGTGRFAAEQVFDKTQADPEEELRRAVEGGPVVAEIKREEAEDILRRASQFRWDREFPSRPGIPDEAILVWTLRMKGGDEVSVKVWLREAEADAAMGVVLRALRDHLGRIPECRIYL